MKLFLSAFVQVFLVALNTFLIAKGIIWAVFIVGFLISYVWSRNVKKIAIGGEKERLLYSLGAGCGSLAGLLIGQQLYKLL